MSQRAPKSTSSENSGQTRVRRVYSEDSAAGSRAQESRSSSLSAGTSQRSSSSGNARRSSSRSSSSSGRQPQNRYSHSDSGRRSYQQTSASQGYSRKEQPRRARRKKKRSFAGLAVVIIVLILIGGGVCGYIFAIKPAMEEARIALAERAAYEEKKARPIPALPAIAETAVIGATGDTLLHNSVLSGAWNGSEYDFTESFKAVAPYWSELDYMIANLEVTLGGEEYGDFSGYPSFNAPDTIVRDLKSAGVDMLLTANNHSYDTGAWGFLRTQEVIDDYELDRIGTRLDENTSYVLIKDINGIRFGFTCFTYDTREDPYDQKSLNGTKMSDETEDLVNSFCYSDLNSFYADAWNQVTEMWNADCDVTVFFIHWGNEYQDYPNDTQKEIAQTLADMGIDLIIGGHPHVIQEFETLKGGGGNTTYCLYSMGNMISSQRKAIMNEDDYRGYTEDGLVMEFSYEKLNNGTVRMSGLNVLPTWVDQRDDGVFEVVPLDAGVPSSQWDTAYTESAIASYNRTLGRVGEGYIEARRSFYMPEIAQSLQ